jgi:flagellar assembly protein FliH
MTIRTNLSDIAVSPFQFPPLKQNDTAMEAVASGLAAVLQDAADAGASAPPSENGHDPDAESSAKIAEEEYAKARAEGFRHGLEEGREAGYSAGFSKGVEAGEASVAEAAQRLAAIIVRLGNPLSALEQPVEEAVAALALEVARCVIAGEVNRSRDFLVRLIREAIAKVPLEMAAPRVLLNPGDVDLVRRLVPEVGNGSATLVADETIEAGGCIVVADGEEQSIKDRRWNPRNAGGVSQVNLTLSSRWREVMLTLFDGEDE